MRFKLLLALAIAALVSACTVQPGPDRSGDNAIGSNLTAVSSMTSDTGTDETKVALYDYTCNLIHQFNLTTGVHERAIRSVVPGGTHYVLFEPGGNFVIDLAAQHISIFDKGGTIQDQPIQFVGTPKSASFRPTLGYLVIYDDMKAEIALIKMNSLGTVTGKAKLGPVVSGGVSISAGDVDDQGRLILALSDNSIAVVDIDQSIAQGKWIVLSRFATTLTAMDWLAPTHDNPNQILVKAQGVAALLDTSTGALVGATVTIDNTKVLKTSKSYNPHLIVDQGASVNLIYAAGGQLQSQTVYRPSNVRGNSVDFNNILSSRLSLANNSWSIVDTRASRIWVGIDWFGRILYDDPNAAKESRSLKKYRFSDLMAMKLMALPDEVQLEVTEASIFQLYPHHLGLAKNLNMATGQVTSFEGFNYPYQCLH